MSRRRQWTPEKRERASIRGKSLWESRSPEERERILAKGRAAYEAKYPERVAISAQTNAAILDGELVPGPCRFCGLPDAAPEHDWALLRFSGWSHYDCRKAAR